MHHHLKTLPFRVNSGKIVVKKYTRIARIVEENTLLIKNYAIISYVTIYSIKSIAWNE